MVSRKIVIKACSSLLWWRQLYNKLPIFPVLGRRWDQQIGGPLGRPALSDPTLPCQTLTGKPETLLYKGQ